MNIFKLFKPKINKKINGKNNKINCKNMNIDIIGNNNNINISENIVIKNPQFNRIIIEGNNNKITICNDFENRNSLFIKIVGDNNEIVIGPKTLIVDHLSILILENCENGEIIIGEKTSFWKTFLQTTDINSTIKIGNDCQFSFNTAVINSDGHAIFQNGKLINRGYNLSIGNHCWIAYNATIYKNAQVPDGTIVAQSAIVTSSGNWLGKKNCIIGGIPAKLIKENIEWYNDRPNQIIRKGIDSNFNQQNNKEI